MAEDIEIVRHFGTLDEAERARRYLEDNGLQPIISDELHRRGGGDGLYALLVPASQIERADELLLEMPPLEEAEAIETLEEWEEGHDDVRQNLEED